MFRRLSVFVLLFSASALGQSLDTMGTLPFGYYRLEDTPEQKKAKEQFCQEFGHDWSPVVAITLAYCPEYTVDLADRTLRITPHCNQRRGSCRRCGKPLNSPPIPDDTLVIHTYSEPDVIARRKHLLEQMERRLEPDTARQYILDMPVLESLVADTSRRVTDSLDVKSARSALWTEPYYDTTSLGTWYLCEKEEDSIKTLWKKIRNLQRQIKKYKQRAAIDTTTMGMVTFTPMDARASAKGVAYRYPAPLGWWYMIRRKH